MENLKETMEDVLENNILNYWLDKVVDNENGGFYGRIDGHEQVCPEAEKGAVMNARILWAFSAAYRVLGKPEYLEAATRAKEYIRDYFLDHEYGGVYWSVDYKGRPLDTKKQTYAIGFAIYGFSEYARATGDQESLDIAISLYHDIEKHAFDSENNGYIEALTCEWNPIADMRLSDKDENGSRTMNTHLHVIEPYTNLYRVWKVPELEKSIRNLLDIWLRATSVTSFASSALNSTIPCMGSYPGAEAVNEYFPTGRSMQATPLSSSSIDLPSNVSVALVGVT